MPNAGATEGILKTPMTRRQFMAYTGEAGMAAMPASPIVAAASAAG